MPSAPTQVIWIIALIAGILGILGHYISIDILTQYNFELLAVGFLLLVIGTSFRGV